MAEAQSTDNKQPYLEVLEDNRVKLVADMNIEDGLCNYLLQYKIATDREVNRIRQSGIQEKQVECLLDHLKTRPVQDFVNFAKSLEETNQNHLAKLFPIALGKRKLEDDKSSSSPNVTAALGKRKREDIKSSFCPNVTADQFTPWSASKAAYNMGPISVYINGESVMEEMEQVVTLASAIASSRVKGYIKLVNTQFQDIDAEHFSKWKNEVLVMLKQLIGEKCGELFTFSRNTANENTFYLHVVPASTPLLVPPLFTKLYSLVMPATKEELMEEMIKISPHCKCFVLNNDGNPEKLSHVQFMERLERIIKLKKVDKIAGFPDEEMKKYKRVEMPNADCSVFTMYGADDGIPVKTGLQIWPGQYEKLLGLAGETQMKKREKLKMVVTTLQHEYKKTKGLVYISPCIKIGDAKNRQEKGNGIICDIVVITSAHMPLLLTVTFEGQNVDEYSSSTVPYLDQMLSCTQPCACTFYVTHHVITSKTLNNGNWLKDVIEEVQENKMNPGSYLQIGEEKCKSMVYSLYTSLASFVPSTFVLDRESTEYVRTMNLMTVEQLNILLKCQADPANVILLKALAGTGKTVLAVEYMKWVRSLGVKEDEVLYVTYSKVLAKQIREIKLPWCHTNAGDPVCQVTTISDMLTWEELPIKFKAVRWWILDDVQNYSSVEKKVTPNKNQDKKWPHDRDNLEVIYTRQKRDMPLSMANEEKIHHNTHGSMLTKAHAASAVMSRDTKITEENPHIFNTSAPSNTWLTQLKTLVSQTNIQKMLLICDPTQALGKGGQKELESIQNVIKFDTHLTLKQISRNSIEISKFIKELMPSDVLKANGYTGLDIKDMVAHKYKGKEPERNIDCSYDFGALEDMMDGLQHKLLNTDTIREDDVGIIIDKSAVTAETAASDMIKADTEIEWGPLDDFVGIEKPYIIAVLGCNAHWCQKVALASRARVGLYWTELKEPVSSAKLKQLFQSRNNSYTAWVTSGKTAIAVFGGYRGDTDRPLERVIAAPVTSQGLGGQFEEVAEIPRVPHPRYLTAVVRYQDEVWLIGGRDEDRRTLSGCDILNLVNWRWRTGPSMRTPRSLHTATMVAGEVITVGGLNVHSKHLSSTETLGAENKWRPGPNLPEKRLGHAACELEGRVYISGGRDDTGTLLTSNTKLTSVMSWTLGETSWRQEPSLTTGRSEHTMVATGGGLLVCGGYGEYSMEQFNSLSRTWSRLTTRIQEDKYRSSAVVHSGVLYLVGGYSPITRRYDGVWHKDQEMPWNMYDTEACLIELPITR